MVKLELEANDTEVIEKIRKLRLEIRKLENKLKEYIKGLIDIDEIIKSSEEINKIKFVTKVFENLDMEALREITDRLIDKGLDLVVMFNKLDNKVVIVVKRNKKLDKIHSGKVAKMLAEVLGGGGGGRPDFAQAGGKDPTKINDAIQKLKEFLKEC